MTPTASPTFSSVRRSQPVTPSHLRSLTRLCGSVRHEPRRSRLLVVYVAGNDATSRKRQVYVEEMWSSLQAHATR